MGSLIKSLPSVNKTYTGILKKNKITTTEEFLKLAICDVSRQNLSEKLGVSKRLISKWVNQVDLLRVNGIGPKYLKLLDQISIDSLSKLSQQNPERISQKINSFDEEHPQIIKRVPSKKMITKWVNNARNTKRVIQNLSDDINIIGKDSIEKVFNLQRFVLDLMWAEEWKNLKILGEKIKAESVFDITRLKLEIEEVEKKNITNNIALQKKLLRRLKNDEFRNAIIKQFPEENQAEITKILEKELAILEQGGEKEPFDYKTLIISRMGNNLDNNFFLYMLGHFIILAAQFHIVLKNKERFNEEISHNFTPEMRRKVGLECGKFEANQIKERFEKILSEISKLPSNETIIIKSEKYLKDLSNMLIVLKINFHIFNLKEDRLIIKIYQQYKKVLQNNLSILTQNKISPAISRSFPTNEAILNSKDFSSNLIDEIYKSYGMGGII